MNHFAGEDVGADHPGEQLPVFGWLEWLARHLPYRIEDCPECAAPLSLTAVVCPYCGWELPQRDLPA